MEKAESYHKTLTLTVGKCGGLGATIRDNSKNTDDEIEIESPLSNNILDIVDDIGSPKMNFRKSLISTFKHNRDSIKKDNNKKNKGASEMK